jgi:molybdenum cofactor cytidylyltransferase
MSLSLARALRVSSSPCIAFVGAGGKTTALFQLARQLGQPVIVTATSHLGTWQLQQADRHIIARSPAPLEELGHGSTGISLVTGDLEGDRTKPIDDELLNWLHEFCEDRSIPLLIEADGAREKPLKAWAHHEPPIPAFVETVVQVAGLTGLNKSLNEDHVHRAARFSELSGEALGETITPGSLARLLTHPEGGLKNIPARARRAVLLNQADTLELQAAAHALTQSLSNAYDSIVIASLRQEQIFAVHEPVAGIILAAGSSSRFGETKQVLDWKGQPFVRAVAITVLQAGLSPLIVVTGAHASRVESALEGLDVIVLRNEEWASGQASSIRAGIRSLMAASPELRQIRHIGSTIFLLADQPQVTSSVLRGLVEKHAEALYPIVAPMVMDRRANPVLFDRVTFSDLLGLEGDVGGRAIFHKHRVEYLPWHDDRLLLDVDTPDMYRRLLSDESL